MTREQIESALERGEKSHLNIEPPELVATKKYQITFEWPNGDWTWIDRDLFDYHEAMLVALRSCPRECRVHNIQLMRAAR